MKQFQLVSRVRHIRFAFFISNNFSRERIIALINHNQRLWGGRFNPIIRVENGRIDPLYNSFIKYLDPDVVFHSADIATEIKALREFSPLRYVDLDDFDIYDDELMGYYNFQLLEKEANRRPLLVPHPHSTCENSMYSYFKINYGYDHEWFKTFAAALRTYDQRFVDGVDTGKINQLAAEADIIGMPELSEKQSSTRMLDDENIHERIRTCLFIVGTDETDIENLLYFWNRRIVSRTPVLYGTVAQLVELSRDVNFSAVLTSNTLEFRSVTLTSLSLGNDAIWDLVNAHFSDNLWSKFNFQVKTDISFLDEKRLGSFDTNWTPSSEFFSQTILTNKGVYQVPQISMTKNPLSYQQKWMIDIDIVMAEEDRVGRITFPVTACATDFIRTTSARINKKRGISIEVTARDTPRVLDFEAPEFQKDLYQVVTTPVVEGKMKHFWHYDMIDFHDSSNRLNGFISLFKGNFYTIEKYFTDKFWVDVFEDICNNNRPSGDAVTLRTLVEKAKDIILKRGWLMPSLNVSNIYERITNLPEVDDDKWINAKKEDFTEKKLKNIEALIMQSLSDLVGYNVFLQGYSLKCASCSSVFWYAIKDVSSHVECKGCLQSFRLPMEPAFSYKLNDLIKNNIFTSKGQRDGNLTVIRTLANLSTRQIEALFRFSPQVELFGDIDPEKPSKPIGDIDVICMVGKQFVIGEAKHTSTEFRSQHHKSLESLIDVSENIRPDKVVLSCYDNPHRHLEKAVAYLRNRFSKWNYAPELEAIHLKQPDYSQFEHDIYRYVYLPSD